MVLFFIQPQSFSSWWSLVAVSLFVYSWGAKWAEQIINAGEKTLQTTYLSAHVDLTMFLLQSWNPALTGTLLKKWESAAFSQINFALKNIYHKQLIWDVLFFCIFVLEVLKSNLVIVHFQHFSPDSVPHTVCLIKWKA